jgi:uncharacterized protein
MDIQPLLIQIASQYKLNPDGTHGISHWGRVLENGLKLAESEGGDLTVIRLFAIFHDACRQNDIIDPGHGKRGARLAEQLLSGHPELSSSQLELLMEACQFHTDGRTKADLTVMICWDADRLDLSRAGIKPHPRHLCTSTAKERSIITWANQRAQSNFSPHFVESEWRPAFFVKE